jgi:tRNA-specific 2-thiouridylase
MCNQHVKFGRFLDFAISNGADYIATGHYAQRIEGGQGAEMHRGVDIGKDQTYFLWTLSQEQLNRTLFPVGDTPKEQIRLEAEAASIPVAAKKDSQGICFLGHVDIPEFLSHYIDLVPGEVLDTDGNVVGTHKGALVYTTGQRHGLTITNQDANRKPLFIVDRDIKANTLTVAAQLQSVTETDVIELSNSVLRTSIQTGDTLELQIRYRQTPINATAVHVDGEVIKLQPTEPMDKPAAGQSCVLYRGSLCLGGGIIR